MQIVPLVAVVTLLATGAAWAQEKRPINAIGMIALLSKGMSVNSSDLKGGSEFTGRVNLEASGILSGTLNVVGHGQVALSGTWKLKGAQLCRTLAPIEPNEVCETWLRTGPRQAVVQVNGRETSINNW